MADPTLPLRLFALGPPEVRLGEILLTTPTRKTLALLIYSHKQCLACHGNALCDADETLYQYTNTKGY